MEQRYFLRGDRAKGCKMRAQRRYLLCSAACRRTRRGLCAAACRQALCRGRVALQNETAAIERAAQKRARKNESTFQRSRSGFAGRSRYAQYVGGGLLFSQILPAVVPVPAKTQ